MENIGLKLHQRLLMTTMVTLAAGRRAKLALRLDTFTEILTSPSKKLDFLLFYCYNKVTSKLFQQIDQDIIFLYNPAQAH